jgi:hypothetical protein
MPRSWLNVKRKRAEEAMTKLKTIIGLLVAVVAVVGVVAFGAAQASASSAPIVIPYEKKCTGGVCDGPAGDDGTLHMEVTGYRSTGDAAQLTVTERITDGDISFTAEMTGHFSPAGFIVLNGTVTSGSFAGARVHQRSNFVSADATSDSWVGELRLMPASG